MLGIFILNRSDYAPLLRVIKYTSQKFDAGLMRLFSQNVLLHVDVVAHYRLHA